MLSTNEAMIPALIKWAIFGLLALICYGRLPGNDLAIIVVLFIAVRLYKILSEFRRTRLNKDESGRSRRELLAEVAGLLAFAVLVPLDIALGSMDFFSFRLSHGWRGAAIVGGCLFLYGVPHLWRAPSRFGKARALWWFAPFFPALFGLLAGINTKHPYLNAFHPEHRRLAAERVLSLNDGIVAGYHADWVLRYAVELDRRGDPEAAHFYRESLRLDANLKEARQRLASLEGKNIPIAASSQSLAANAPYWSAERPITKAQRIVPNTPLAIDTCTVVVASVGDVPEVMLDAVAHAIHHELGLPVRVSTMSITLPPHTRVRGLLTGRQWNQAVIVGEFQKHYRLEEDSIVRYVIVTSADLCAGEENYMFAASYGFGALVSFARFLDSSANPASPIALHRAAKQALGSLIKSFKVPQSHERACVTSYPRSLDEFDAKGSRPVPSTMEQFKREVALVNARTRLRGTTNPAPSQ